MQFKEAFEQCQQEMTAESASAYTSPQKKHLLINSSFSFLPCVLTWFHSAITGKESEADKTKSPSEAKLSAEAKPSLGEMFKPKPGQWECQVKRTTNEFANALVGKMTCFVDAAVDLIVRSDKQSVQSHPRRDDLMSSMDLKRLQDAPERLSNGVLFFLHTDMLRTKQRWGYFLRRLPNTKRWSSRYCSGTQERHLWSLQFWS